MQKPGSIFRFKKFNVVNERSAMKVNTDGVLLGAAMTILPSDRRLLDIGTGTGTIALMAAQRLCTMISHPSDLQTPHPSGAISMEESQHPSASSTDQGQNQLQEPDGETGGQLYRGICIHAIDIDEPSASEAAANFKNSPWASVLHAHHASLEAFSATELQTPASQQDPAPASQQDPAPTSQQDSTPASKASFDLIFSNPPYFEDSLTAPDERKSTARHTSDGLSYRDIFEFANERLTQEGRVALVLPADQEASLCRYARMCGFHMFRILRVRTVPRKAPSRIIAEFSRLRCPEPQDSILTIQNEGQYTQEYLSLTHDFYMFA